MAALNLRPGELTQEQVSTAAPSLNGCVCLLARFARGPPLKFSVYACRKECASGATLLYAERVHGFVCRRRGLP